MDQQVIDFLRGTSKTSLEICSQFNMTIVDTMALMERLKRDGRVWQSKRRTLGKRNVSRWGLVE